MEPNNIDKTDELEIIRFINSNKSKFCIVDVLVNIKSSKDVDVYIVTEPGNELKALVRLEPSLYTTRSLMIKAISRDGRKLKILTEHEITYFISIISTKDAKDIKIKEIKMGGEN